LPGGAATTVCFADPTPEAERDEEGDRTGDESDAYLCRATTSPWGSDQRQPRAIQTTRFDGPFTVTAATAVRAGQFRTRSALPRVTRRPLRPHCHLTTPCSAIRGRRHGLRRAQRTRVTTARSRSVPRRNTSPTRARRSRYCGKRGESVVTKSGNSITDCHGLGSRAAHRNTIKVTGAPGEDRSTAAGIAFPVTAYTTPAPSLHLHRPRRRCNPGPAVTSITTSSLDAPATSL